MRCRFRSAAPLLLLLLLVGSTTMRPRAPAFAQAAGSSQAPAASGNAPAAGPSSEDKHPKLDSQLSAVARVRREAGPGPATAAAQARALRVAQERVQVVVQTLAMDRSTVRALVLGASGQVQAEYADLVQALLPITALESVAAHPAVRYVRPPHRPQVAAVDGEGPVASNARAWQSVGTAGTGVKIAIVDMGFAGLETRQAEGDLPAVTTADFCGGGFSTATVHGTGVAEVVHEMAPGAQLYLICVATEVNLGQATDYAVANGVHIVTHSILWLNTARGDGSGAAGTPDAIVADARAHGILWVNAAGNYQRRHWSGTFFDTDADDRHNFALGRNDSRFTFPGGATRCFYLKWDDWPVSAQDYDLHLVSTDGTILLSSTNAQTGTQAPTESLCAVNRGATETVGIAIARVNATLAPRLDLFSPNTDLEFQVPAGSITEPGSSPLALAAGAICWQNDSLEPYSSLGPAIDGRTKPDLVGQDAVSSATYGPFSGCGTSGFTGTSAAAPHLAGAAALVKQAEPVFTTAQVQAFLMGRAVDLGTAGSDNAFGAGRLWLGAPATRTPTPTPTQTPTPTRTPTPPVTATWTPTPLPRPNVGVAVTPGNAGRLLVTISARSTGCTPNNVLLSIAFTGLANARVAWPGPPGTTITSPAVVPVPGSAAAYQFTVERGTAGAASTVQLTVTDGCGAWPTFVGGGPAAF